MTSVLWTCLIFLSSSYLYADEVAADPFPKHEILSALVRAEQFLSAPQAMTIKSLTGEVISYSIKEGILRIGSAKMAFEGLVGDGDEKSALIHVNWKIPGFSSDERIYVDPETFYPRFVYKERNKFGCKITVLEDYFPDEGKVSIYRDTCGTIEQSVADRGAPVESIYAMIYHLRMSAGSIDDVQPFTVRLPDRDESFKLEEIKKLNYARQEYETRHFASQTFGIWMDESLDRLPLRIDSSEEHSVTMVMKSRKFSVNPEVEIEEDAETQEEPDVAGHLSDAGVAHAAQVTNH